VVCSLEPWDEVWRRNQFFAAALLRRNPELRVLFVEPPADVLFDLLQRRLPALPRLRMVGQGARIRALRPLKALPRRVGSVVDRSLRAQVLLGIQAVGFSRPTIWVNDVTFAPLLGRRGWPSVFDVTDDWLLAPFAPRELERLRRLEATALAAADEVVVCSPALAASRGATRRVHLIPNGVEVERFRRPQQRPKDLPVGRTAVYAGSLHEARLDLELVVELAAELEHVQVVFVGPDSLSAAGRRRLESLPNVSLLGQRPYTEVPAYLQHADVLIVPHAVSEFTNSLDPIKAYECLAVETPTVATPVAGFRELAGAVTVAERPGFVRAVADVLSGAVIRTGSVVPADWEKRAVAFEDVLLRAGESTG
jgi:glycosyltransferase involved in cell wall biosynthesis